MEYVLGVLRKQHRFLQSVCGISGHDPKFDRDSLRFDLCTIHRNGWKHTNQPECDRLRNSECCLKERDNQSVCSIGQQHCESRGGSGRQFDHAGSKGCAKHFGNSGGNAGWRGAELDGGS
jgi:hypothetical protein